jgi:hypothetical protein
MGVCVETIRMWKMAGAPYQKLGSNLFRYKMSDLRDWKDSQPVKQRYPSGIEDLPYHVLVQRAHHKVTKAIKDGSLIKAV